jgi:hypothetical protein
MELNACFRALGSMVGSLYHNGVLVQEFHIGFGILLFCC